MDDGIYDALNGRDCYEHAERDRKHSKPDTRPRPFSIHFFLPPLRPPLRRPLHFLLFIIVVVLRLRVTALVVVLV